MIPKEPEELEDDEDAWTARAYGEADFSRRRRRRKIRRSRSSTI
jgi:hypothetical protein